MSSLCVFIVCAFVLYVVRGEVEVNALFSDGMVLQTSKQAGFRSFLYGTAAPNEPIKITGSIMGAPYSINARNDGLWKIELNPDTNFAINMTMNVIGQNNTIQINDIKIGEIFLCIGSKNMMYPMSDIFNASNYIQNSVKYPSIKIVTLPTINANEPQNMYPSSANIKWKQANPNTLPSFSAICYLSAQKLLDLYGDGRNMGLIQVAVDDSTLNCWMSQNALKTASTQCDDLDKEEEMLSFEASVCNDSTLFNGMINPLVEQTYRSGIYYQGGNEQISTNYGCKFAIMMNDYRDMFGSGDFAFAYVQASSVYNNDIISNMRMEQSTDEPRMDGIVDTTAMIVSYDLGNKSSDTPSHKAEIGERIGLKLARIAPVLLYDHNSTLYDGPYIFNAIYNSNDKLISLHFTNLDNKSLLLSPTLDCVQGCCSANNVFQISSDNKNWLNATSYKIDRNNPNVINISVPTDMNDVKYIRYGYSSFVECAIYRNGLNIPCAPFSIATAVHGNGNMNNKVYITEKSNYKMESPQIERCAMTPPMGFNHWNFAHCNIDERLVKQVAQFMFDSGLRDAGYQYFNLDDCWQTDRDYSSQTIIPDSVRFPSGMKSLANWLKSKTFKFGVYTARKQYTCQGRYGSYMHEAIDVQSYCEWGVSYIKVDACGGTDYQYPNQSWIKFRNAIDECYNKTGQDMVLSVESCGSTTGCGEWIGNIANMWRTDGDIQDNWKSMIGSADKAQSMYSIAGPGHWNDADMLEIGNPGMSSNEQKVHFSLWAIMASPLLIGTNLLSITDDSLDILLNKEVISVNQDVLGIQGHKLYPNTSGTEIWFRPLQNSNVAVCLLNRMDGKNADITLRFSDIGIASTTKTVGIRDLWQHQNLGNYSYSDTYTANNVCSHCCKMFKLVPYE